MDGQAVSRLPRFAEALEETPIKSRSIMTSFGPRMRMQVAKQDISEMASIGPARDHVIVFPLSQPKAVHRFYDGRHAGSVTKKRIASIIPAGRSSAWQSDVEVQVLHFYVDDDLVQEIAQDALNINRPVVINDHLETRDDFIERLAPMGLQLMRDDTHESHLIIDSFYEALALHLIRAYSNCATAMRKAVEAPIQSDEHLIRQVKEYIADNLDQPLSLVEISGMLGVQIFRLSRTFKAMEGITLHKFILNQRVDRVKELLSTKMPLAEIAYDTGFSSQAHMTTTFTRIVGMPPGKFRGFTA